MEKVWKLIESLMHFCIFKILHIPLKEENWNKLCQFLKFGIVGLSNTMLSYVVYVLMVSVSIHYLLASLAGFVISVINAYYWNNRYVFRCDDNGNRIWWKVFLKTFMSYAGTGLILNNILLILWIQVLNIPEIIGPAINLFITIPLNFVLNKYWAYRK